MQTTHRTNKELMRVAALDLMDKDAEFIYPARVVNESEEGIIFEFLNPRASHPDYVIDPPGICYFVNRATLEIELYPQY